LATRGILDDPGPCFIGFAESYGIGMARSAVSTEGFIGHFRNVRAAHHHRHTDRTNGVRNAVGFCDHASHRANPDKSDVLFANESGDIHFIHGLRVAIDQQYLMASRSQCLEEEHPQVRHEIPRHAIVGVVE
jgi:hypothetical protein